VAAGTAKVYNFTLKPSERKTVRQSLTANGDVSTWVQCSGDIAIQLVGAATAVTAVVERSPVHPSEGAIAGPVSTTPLTGNPSTGMPVASFFEPGVAWWRVRLTALTGDALTVAVSAVG
jgi:hypothetical protein